MSKVMLDMEHTHITSQTNGDFIHGPKGNIIILYHMYKSAPSTLKRTPDIHSCVMVIEERVQGGLTLGSEL